MVAELFILGLVALFVFALYVLVWVPYRANRAAQSARIEAARESARRRALEDEVKSSMAEAAEARIEADTAFIARHSRPGPTSVRTTYVTQADPIPYLETVVETIVEEVEEEVVYVAPVYVAPAYVAPVAVATSFAMVDAFTPSYSPSYEPSPSYDSGSSDSGSSSFD